MVKSEQKQPDTEQDAKRDFPVLDDLESEEQSGYSDEVVDGYGEIDSSEEDESDRTEVGHGNHQQGSRESQQAAGNHANHNERDGGGTLSDGAKQQPPRPGKIGPIGHVGHHPPEAPAGQLSEMSPDAIDAKEEERQTTEKNRRKLYHESMWSLS